MKYLLLNSAFIFLTTALFAQNNANDEMTIKNVIQQQEALWNKHDWEAFGNYLTDDATLINFVGEFWTGKNDIISHFKKLDACCLTPTSLKLDFKNARFITPDIAIVYIEETIVADKDYNTPFHNYKKGETEYKMATNVFVKKNNAWKITAVQLTLINQVLSPHSSTHK